MFVFSEEIVENTESRLQIQVDDVFGPCLGFWQSGVLHQFEGQTDVDHFFVK